MKAHKMLRKKNYRGYLVSIVSVQPSDLTAVGVLVVWHFMDVILKYLYGVPPNKQVEFTIDLIPGAIPIYKVPFRMAPKELHELKVQLQELLDKKFI